MRKHPGWAGGAKRPLYRWLDRELALTVLVSTQNPIKTLFKTAQTTYAWFMYSVPLAYMLTWHIYGTWLHGDPAGSVDRRHNVFGEPRLPGDPVLFARKRAGMKQEPLFLSVPAREVVDAAIVRHCRFRGWTLQQASVRSNHVHVIVTAIDDPDVVTKELKDWGTRDLRRAGLAGPKRNIWVDGGSKVYIFSTEQFWRLMDYVKNGQEGSDHGRPHWKDAYLG